MCGLHVNALWMIWRGTAVRVRRRLEAELLVGRGEAIVAQDEEEHVRFGVQPLEDEIRRDQTRSDEIRRDRHLDPSFLEDERVVRVDVVKDEPGEHARAEQVDLMCVSVRVCARARV